MASNATRICKRHDFLNFVYFYNRSLDGRSNVVRFSSWENSRISNYAGGFLLLTLPVAWLFLYLGLGPISVCWAYLITMSLCSIGRVFWAKHLVQFSPSIWLKEVFLPLMFLLTASVFTGRMSQLFLDASLGRLSLVVAATLLTNILLGWNLLLNTKERKTLLAALQSSLKRIYKLIRHQK